MNAQSMLQGLVGSVTGAIGDVAGINKDIKKAETARTTVKEKLKAKKENKAKMRVSKIKVGD